MAKTFDLEQVRRDTPGVEQVMHFNNAGSALPPEIVVTTMTNYLRREATIGGYEAAAEAHKQLDAVYTSLAALIGAQPAHLAVVENATRAWDMAVYGYPFEADYAPAAFLIGQGEKLWLAPMLLALLAPLREVVARLRSQIQDRVERLGINLHRLQLFDPNLCHTRGHRSGLPRRLDLVRQLHQIFVTRL